MHFSSLGATRGLSCLAGLAELPSQVCSLIFGLKAGRSLFLKYDLNICFCLSHIFSQLSSQIVIILRGKEGESMEIQVASFCPLQSDLLVKIMLVAPRSELSDNSDGHL